MAVLAPDGYPVVSRASPVVRGDAYLVRKMRQQLLSGLGEERGIVNDHEGSGTETFPTLRTMTAMRPWILATFFVVFGVIVETVCSGKKPGDVMKKLRQPSWALPMAAWYVVGVSYYAMCFAIVYRITASGKEVAVPLALIAGMMLANAGWNLIFFRLRALRWSLWFYAPYILLVAVLIYALWSIDKVSASLLLVYSAYLPYALVWS